MGRNRTGAPSPRHLLWGGDGTQTHPWESRVSGACNSSWASKDRSFSRIWGSWAGCRQPRSKGISWGSTSPRAGPGNSKMDGFAGAHPESHPAQCSGRVYPWVSRAPSSSVHAGGATEQPEGARMPLVLREQLPPPAACSPYPHYQLGAPVPSPAWVSTTLSCRSSAEYPVQSCAEVASPSRRGPTCCP